MTALPRDVFKWLQSLDLTFPVRNVRRDFSNGYLVAEIFSWYYPQDIPMHSYDNCSGLPGKVGNWSQLKTFFKRRSIEIPQELVEGTIHAKPDAAELLVQFLYTKLTNRKIKRLALDHDIDFTDHRYQLSIPIHARATASMAVKTNVKITEAMTEPNLITGQQRAQEIIHKRIQHRQEERLEDPERFCIKPTIGQRCVRKPPVQPGQSFEQEEEVQGTSRQEHGSPVTRRQRPSPAEQTRSESQDKAKSPSMVHFKDINVSQLDHVAQQGSSRNRAISSSPVLDHVAQQGSSRNRAISSSPVLDHVAQQGSSRNRAISSSPVLDHVAQQGSSRNRAISSSPVLDHVAQQGSNRNRAISSSPVLDHVAQQGSSRNRAISSSPVLDHVAQQGSSRNRAISSSPVLDHVAQQGSSRNRAISSSPVLDHVAQQGSSRNRAISSSPVLDHVAQQGSSRNRAISSSPVLDHVAQQGSSRNRAISSSPVLDHVAQQGSSRNRAISSSPVLDHVAQQGSSRNRAISSSPVLDHVAQQGSSRNRAISSSPVLPPIGTQFAHSEGLYNNWPKEEVCS